VCLVLLCVVLIRRSGERDPDTDDDE
jgi:hypothetical protein